MSGYVAEGSGGEPVQLKGMSPIRLTTLLIFTQLPSVLAYTIALPLLAKMAGDLAQDPTSAYMAKLVSGILGPAMALGALVAGILADRFDRRWLVMLYGAVFVVFGMAPAFLTNVELIVVSRFVMGYAAASLMATGYTMVGDYLPENKRAKTIGMLSAMNMVVSLSSMPVAGYVAGEGWRTAFYLYLAAVPLLLLAMPSRLPAPQRVAPAERSKGGGSWFEGMPIGLLAIALGVGVILTIPGIYISFHLATIGLGKPSTVALLMSSNSAVAAIFSAIFGRALQSTSQKAVFCGAFGIMALGLVLLSLAPGLAMALPGLLMMGAGMGWLTPGMPALAVERAAEGQRGKLVGAVQGMSSVAPILGVTIAEPLAPILGTSGVMFSIGLLSALLVLPFALQRGRPRVTAPAA